MTAKQKKMGLPECDCKSADYDCHKDECAHYDNYGKLKPKIAFVIEQWYSPAFDKIVPRDTRTDGFVFDRIHSKDGRLPYRIEEETKSGPCPIIDDEDDGVGALSF